ncbi:MAG: hypothetical protein LBE92_04815 [Chryseobacterium sp.]|jgi:hypothetical protein|uniref:hypothetical protein n=1 Tax=Chryseobacterium sp. TaxID=1871047 RepID=UPI00281A699C|nr:hypothetical protein [Chryseobacterium sp.]MDR2235422.1 hypothetical protein [Chryseobacterium sp.]
MNNLDNLMNRIQEEGYYCEYKQISDVSEKILFCGIKDNTFVVKLGREFYIRTTDNKYNIQYADSQLGLEKDFTDPEELIKFVRQVFPIEE